MKENLEEYLKNGGEIIELKQNETEPIDIEKMAIVMALQIMGRKD